LERELRPGDMPQDDSVLVMPVPGQPGLLFLRVPGGEDGEEPEGGKTAKNRIDFDLWPTSARRDEQVERAIGLGTAVLDDRCREDGTGWVVFADPGGTSSASDEVPPSERQCALTRADSGFRATRQGRRYARCGSLDIYPLIHAERVVLVLT